jgi:hypothetical protein
MDTETKLLHFDSANWASYKTDISGVRDPFNASFSIRNPISKIKKISFKSIELPVSFNNIRSGLNVFGFTLSGVDYSVSLTEGNYTSITTLCNDINTLFSSSGVLPIGDSVTLSVVNSVYIKVSYTTTSPTLKFFKVFGDSRLCLSILGLQSVSTHSLSGNTTSITGLCPYSLSIDHYITMFISNVYTEGNTASGLNSTFKIPLNAVSGVVYYSSNKTGLEQSVSFGDPNQILTKLDVTIYDRFGNILTNQGNDYSFTLEFECWR